MLPLSDLALSVVSWQISPYNKTAGGRRVREDIAESVSAKVWLKKKCARERLEKYIFLRITLVRMKWRKKKQGRVRRVEGVNTLRKSAIATIRFGREWFKILGIYFSSDSSPHVVIVIAINLAYCSKGLSRTLAPRWELCSGFLGLRRDFPNT